MDDHPGRFVDNQEYIVLVDDADRDGFAGNDPFFNRWDLDPDQLAFLRLVTRLFTPAIDEYMALGDQGSRLSP